MSGKVERISEVLVAVETIFSWAVQRPVSVSNMTEVTCMNIGLGEYNEVSKQLRMCWELESLGITTKDVDTADDS